MPLIALAILVVLLILVLIPLSIVQRFRVAAAERPARRWVATLNLFAIACSTLLFLAGALITSRWVSGAVSYTAAGLAIGAVVGLIGLALTRWKYVDGRLRYAPNRLLVLGLTTVIAARVLYGFWRTWETWRAGFESIAPGLAASMSAGAVVLGYYLVFWAGVRWRMRRTRP